MALQVTSCTMRQKPERLLDKGAKYFMARTNAQMFRSENRKSAVELLEASKAQYVKSSSVLDGHPDSRYSDNRQASDNHRDPRHTDNPLSANRCQSAVQLLCKKSESAPTLSSSHRSTVNYRNHLERCILSQGSTNAQQAQKHSERNSSKMTDKSITRTPPSSRPVSGSSRSSGIRSSLDAVQDREMYLKPSNCQKLSTSVGVLIDHTSKSQPPTSPRPDERGENIVILRHQKKSIHRSHSDLSYRPCRNSSDFSDLSSRLSRTSAELERFFNEMGLDKSVLNPLYGKHRSGIYSDFDLFESLSSLDSPDTRSVCSGVSKSEKGHVDPADMAERSTATSIVEKNARIIRWLCSVKKAKAKPT